MSEVKESQSLSLATSNQILDLLQAVVTNPQVSVEKVQALWTMQREMEATRAEALFDAAMIDAQKEVRALSWDKVNVERNSRHVSYKKIYEMLQPIREKYGFGENFGVEPTQPAPNMMLAYADVIHTGGHRRRFHLPMPIDNSGPKGGSGIMTTQQAVGSGMSYVMRILDKGIWKIPMLVDKDDNDGNQVRANVSEGQAKVLRDLLSRLGEDRQKKALEYLSQTFKQEITAVEDIPASRYKHAETTLARALNSEGSEKSGQDALINDLQITTLQEVIEGIGKNCKSDFLAHFKIKRIGELPISKYPDALKWLEGKRRG